MFVCDVTTSNKTIVLYISTLVLVYIITDHNRRSDYKKVLRYL